MPLKLVQEVHDLIKTSEKFRDKEQNLYIPKILEAIEQIDSELIKLLISDEIIKNYFFTKIEDVYVLNQNKLIEFFTMNEFSKSSYTSYTNKIGLIKKDSFVKKFDDVVLAWPHKDCVLEGGQSRDDEKNNEVFYNEILSRDEIDRLFEPKALTNIKKFSVHPELVEGCTHGSTSSPRTANFDSPRTVNSDCEESTPTEITEDDNLIIKGNNLIVLHSLKKKFAGKVKLIYIDPPYNTGGAANTFAYNNTFNHSTWLTFMKNRLEVAKEFLHEEGAIVVAIDHVELFYIGVLMDEYFGVENRVGLVAVETNPRGRSDSKFFATSHEYFLVYAKSQGIYSLNDFELTSEQKEVFKYSDEISEYRLLPLQRSGSNSTPDKRPKLRYAIYYEPGTKKISLGKFSDTCIEIYPVDGSGVDRVWRISRESCENALLEKNIIVRLNKEKYTVLMKDRIKMGRKPKTFWSNPLYDASSHGTMLLKGFFNSTVFSYPKSIHLMKDILKICSNQNDLILDFFGGSGTTAQAVLDLNKEDKGCRKFIIVEQMDYVKTVTKERVKKVIQKNQEGSFVYAELKQIDTFKDAEIGKLNKNMQYLPVAEMEDEEYGISKEEIAINKKFYTKTGTSGLENE